MYNLLSLRDSRLPWMGKKKAVRASVHRVLFICTGNYFRSRFAEAIFNHYARDRMSGWQAFSRGLAANTAKGRLSLHARNGLRLRGIDPRMTARERIQLKEADLILARHIVALSNEEHRPMIAKQFPEWVRRVSYWEVPDLRTAAAEKVLPAIEREVLALIDWLNSPQNPRRP